MLDEDGVDEDGEEEEVLALQGVSDDSDDEAEYPYHDERGSEDMHVDSEPTTSKSTHKPARDTKKSKSSRKNASDSDSEEDTWGRSKGAYYSSNAAQLDSEDEEANEFEEQEALRLQAKAREVMCDEDFGLGDVVEGDVEPPEAAYACRSRRAHGC
jgi:U3 small nucleolar RNA-associated protein 3